MRKQQKSLIQAASVSGRKREHGASQRVGCGAPLLGTESTSRRNRKTRQELFEDSRRGLTTPAGFPGAPVGRKKAVRSSAAGARVCPPAAPAMGRRLAGELGLRTALPGCIRGGFGTLKEEKGE